MEIQTDFVDAIGNTPLLRLNRASELTGCEILGKAEFLNPGGSVKDRAAWGIISDAEKKGLLRPGGVIVEGTAGNTGIGLALVGNSRGYKSVIVVPETQSQEKFDMLRLCDDVWRWSGGAFDPTVAPLMEAQGFRGEERAARRLSCESAGEVETGGECEHEYHGTYHCIRCGWDSRRGKR